MILSPPQSQEPLGTGMDRPHSCRGLRASKEEGRSVRQRRHPSERAGERVREVVEQWENS